MDAAAEKQPLTQSDWADLQARIAALESLQAEYEVRFWVRDYGCGLCPEEQDRLFAPFTRLHQVRAEGHGLGLSIVRRIVEKLDGKIGVDSEVGRGSLFWFTLPAP